MSSVAEHSLTQLKGVGARTVERLNKLGIHNATELLFHLPLRYEDRTCIRPIGQLQSGDRVLIEGVIQDNEVVSHRRRSLICHLADSSGQISLRFFHFSASQINGLEPGRLLRCFGEVRSGFNQLEMVHPDYQRISEADSGVVDGSLTPVYPTTEGLHQKTLRSLIAQVMQLSEQPAMSSALDEWIPKAILDRLHYPALRDAVQLLHAPSAGEGSDLAQIHQAIIEHTHPAQKRLAFEELLAHHLSMTQMRRISRDRQAPPFQLRHQGHDTFLSQLPFSLTAAQLRVIDEIQADLANDSPMMRLVQGDVGSGKTVVAAYCALSALASGYQVALMAPTELLAEQHYRNFTRWFEPLGVDLRWLTGKQKGKVRATTLSAINEGRAGIVIGTHALFQQAVQFHRLGFVIIDEQHRFGVDQRLALRDKGVTDGLSPHQLVMTATPIPRTLAMLNFSELGVSVIDELPPGRTPVKTSVMPGERREAVIERIDRWVSNRRQVYWVCTLIDESEVLQCEAAEETMKLLAEQLPNVRVALLHGRMKATDKETIMSAFKQHEVDLLVATTVVEVGVDVPNANLMIIENSERLGLSQLHQLRGRVGRGTDQSFCLLLYQTPLSATARERLSIIRNSSDGFEIAEKDLALRGPGEMMGTRQTGQALFRIADLTRDQALLPTVLHAAQYIEQHAPEAIEPLIQRWLGDSAHYAEV